ncbi:hypothetical protein Tco_0138844 [Tanacetum coccineum]
MPRECLRIIESKSKVRNSRNKAVVAKVSSNSSTPGISLHQMNLLLHRRFDLRFDKDCAYRQTKSPSSRTSKSGQAELCNLWSTIHIRNLSSHDGQRLRYNIKDRLCGRRFEQTWRTSNFSGSVFLKTSCALIDVYKGELTLRVGNEAITYNLDQTSRYSVNYNDMTANQIDVVELACEEYSQDVLGFSDMIASGNPTPYYDPIVSNSSLTLTPFEDSDFLLLEKAYAFLALTDDPTSPEVDESYYDPEGDILILKALLNSDPSPPPNQGNYLPEIRKELKICKAKTAKTSIDEPLEVELKDLPPHLEYAFGRQQQVAGHNCQRFECR